MDNSKVLILSDIKGSGKTTALQKWTLKTKNISGFLSPVIEGKRMFQIIETRELIPMETERKDLKVGKYIFDSESFEHIEKSVLTHWGKALVDLIIIDEIGPLEINKNLGFHNLLLHLQNTTSIYRPALFFVVRKACLDQFLIKYGFKDAKIMSLNQFKTTYLNDN